MNNVMTNEEKTANSNKATLVLATVQQLMCAPTYVEPIWYRGKYDGYYASVPDLVRHVEYKTPGPTLFDAACELLALVRSLYPDATDETKFDDNGLLGLSLYTEWNAAKAMEAREQQKEIVNG